ncbi:MAG: M20 family metallopeptidase [Treponema sp.]|jgi:amidohydrolase|nr:M20 family metallopeptidase [Treponema sp.]
MLTQYDVMREAIAGELDGLFAITRYLYENPELGGAEYKGCQTLVDSLTAHHFRVETPFCGLPTAFRAECASGKPGAVIAYFCEYDALPDIGHGCGHNLICAMSLGAAYGLQAALSEVGGTIVVFGTPAEETNGAKVAMAAHGVFEGVTAGIMTHPNGVTKESGPTMALYPLMVSYAGTAAHASMAPEQGVNALDALILCYNGVNALRQHVTRDVQFHGIITAGGVAPNIVPDYAEARFYIRAANKANLADAVARFTRCAEGAAAMTGATLTLAPFQTPFADMRTNAALSAVYNAHLRALGETVQPAGAPGASIDMGDVSYRVPAVHGWLGFGDTALGLHTRAFAERTVTPSGKALLERGALAMAFTGYDVLASEALRQRIAADFAQ